MCIHHSTSQTVWKCTFQLGGKNLQVCWCHNKMCMCVHRSTSQTIWKCTVSARRKKPTCMLVSQQNVSNMSVSRMYLATGGEDVVFYIKKKFGYQRVTLVFQRNISGQRVGWFCQCETFQIYQQIFLSEHLSCRGLLLCFSDSFAL